MTWRAQPLLAALAPVGLMLAAALVFGAIAVKAFSWEE
jgi:hypothetical protein